MGKGYIYMIKKAEDFTLTECEKKSIYKYNKLKEERNNKISQRHTLHNHMASRHGGPMCVCEMWREWENQQQKWRG